MQISLTVCTCVYGICVSVLSRIRNSVGKYKIHSFIRYRFAFGLLFSLCNHFQTSIIVHLICFELLIQNHIKLTNRRYCYFLPPLLHLMIPHKEMWLNANRNPKPNPKGGGGIRKCNTPTNQYIFFIEDI